MPKNIKVYFREGLDEFYLKNYKSTTNKLNDNQRTQGFLIFYLKRVFSSFYPGVFPESFDDIQELITDGKDDQGADLIYKYDDTVYIIQSKYRGKRTTEDENEINNFKSILNRLHPISGQKYKKNDKVEDAISYIDWKNDRFELIFLTLGKGNDDINNTVDEGIPENKDIKGIDERANFQFLDEEELNKDFRDVINKNNTGVGQVELSFKETENNSWLKYFNESNKLSYIGVMAASQVHELFKQKRNPLFSLNIRQFLGDNATNKIIKETAINDSDNFFFFNNGVSAVAQKVTEIGKNKLSCENFSVINGAQTMKSIHKAYVKAIRNNKDIKKLSVMIRVTEVKALYTKDSDFIDKITQFNNTQNAVKISDFRSNDAVQKSLVKHFEKHSYKGKKYFYKNKRDKENPRNSIIISLDEFCRLIYSFEYGPPDFYGGLKHLYDTSPDGGYFELFGEKSTGDLSEEISDNRFKYLSSIYFFWEKGSKYFKEIKNARIEQEQSKKKSSDQSPIFSKRSLEGKYLIVYVIKTILVEILYAQNKTVKQFMTTGKFKNPNWDEDEDLVETVKDIIEMACDTLIGVYVSSYKNKDFVHRNFFREKSTLESIENDLLSKVSTLKAISKKL